MVRSPSDSGQKRQNLQRSPRVSAALSTWYVGCTGDLPERRRVIEQAARSWRLRMSGLTCQSLSDVQLLEQMFAHDEAAWREFCRRYDRLVWRCITKVTT